MRHLRLSLTTNFLCITPWTIFTISFSVFISRIISKSSRTMLATEKERVLDSKDDFLQNWRIYPWNHMYAKKCKTCKHTQTCFKLYSDGFKHLFWEKFVATLLSILFLSIYSSVVTNFCSKRLRTNKRNI